ncbi:MAG: outer membrane protein assembly factor BamD [Alphaproteobacteria bacterium]
MSCKRPWSNRLAFALPRLMTLFVIAVVVMLVALVGCSSDDAVGYKERPVAKLYNQGMDALLANEYREAARLFEEVERQHPYSVWATKAQLMAGFAYYKRNDYDDAIVALDQFIQLHPGNADVAYAYYLKALGYYEQIADVGRDQKSTARAMQTFNELIQRFPDSKYSRDARLKIDLTRDHLAGKEMEIGRYYLTRGHYLAGISRFRKVIDEYQTTTHVPEALHRITEAYLALGVTEEAKKTASVLGHNFPGSEWYIDSYALLTGIDVRPKDEKRGWLARSWNAVF